MVFDFRIIVMADGTEIADRRLSTPWSALTPSQQVEYKEWENRLLFMDRMKRKAEVEKRKRNSLLHRIGSMVMC